MVSLVTFEFELCETQETQGTPGTQVIAKQCAFDSIDRNP